MGHYDEKHFRSHLGSSQKCGPATLAPRLFSQPSAAMGEATGKGSKSKGKGFKGKKGSQPSPAPTGSGGKGPPYKKPASPGPKGSGGKGNMNKGNDGQTERWRGGSHTVW